MTNTAYFEQAALWGKPPQFYQVQVLADILEILPPDVRSVLDVGCGDGFITNALPEQLRVVGVDISQQAVKHVKRETVIGSATDLPLPDRSFDMVMSNDVLEHLEAPREKATEFRRKLKPGGHLIVSGPTENLAYRVGRAVAGFGNKGDYHLTDIDKLRIDIESSGLSLEVTRRLPFHLFLCLFKVFRFRKIPA